MSCSIPVDHSGDVVTLAHGEGGRLMRTLIRDLVLPALGNELLVACDDAVRLPALKRPMVLTTDSFVITPRFFPGGDIGSLAVYGTVNDLAVSGARPHWMSLALIIEEGLPMRELRAVLASVASAAQRVGVRIVTGDTKVVPRGVADGLFINTTGVGEVLVELPGPQHLQPGDQLLVTGPIGRHGSAVMSIREGLEFSPSPISDCAPLVEPVIALADAGVPIRAMRDATRGGIAAVLHEWAESSQTSMALNDSEIPVCPATQGISEVLGLDPLHIANEGTMVVAVPASATSSAIDVLKSIEQTASTARIGEVRARMIAPVIIRRALGREIPLDEPAGAPLPRIC